MARRGRAEDLPSTSFEARRDIGVIWVELRETYRRFQGAKTSVDPDVQSDLLRYTCIRMSGFLEQLVFLSITGYMRERLSDSAQNFYSSWFHRAPNLSSAQFTSLMDRFDEPWRSEFKQFLDEDLRRDELNSLLQLRNDVAHGKSYQGSALNVETYMRLVKEIYCWFGRRLLLP